MYLFIYLVNESDYRDLEPALDDSVTGWLPSLMPYQHIKHFEIEFGKYTQTKKKRPIFMVLYRSIQLRRCNKK